MAAHSYRNQGDANRQSIVESMQSALGLTPAEANARFEDENWEGMNSTDAARQFEQENVTSGSTRAAISVPYEVEDGASEDDVTVQANVPPGVTPPHIIDGDENDGEVKSATAKDEEALTLTPQSEQDNSLFDHTDHRDEVKKGTLANSRSDKDKKSAADKQAAQEQKAQEKVNKAQAEKSQADNLAANKSNDKFGRPAVTK